MQKCPLPSPVSGGASTAPISDSRPARKKSLAYSRPAPVSAPALPLRSLSRWGEGWLLDCEMRRHSGQTSALRRMILKNFGWLAAREGWEAISTAEVRAFLSYLSHGHEDPGGRWGNPQMTRPVRPVTAHTYHAHLKTFFGWLVAEGVLPTSPMATIRPPVARPDQIQPFTPAQIEALLAVTAQGWHPERDAAMLWLLLDTGVRAAELCGLRVRDLDMAEKRIHIAHGKGDKARTVYFGLRCGKALWRYLHSAVGAQPADAEGENLPLFPAEAGNRRGEALSADGLGQMIQRLGQRSGVAGVRVSPHTFRHTFAVSFLRAGGQVYALKEILGHTDIKQTLKYVALADADLAGQRRFSPGDRISGRGISGKVTTAGHPANTPKPAKAKPAKNENTVTRKLSEAAARAIKAAARAGERQKAIAERFGVSASAVKQIKSGAMWGHLE